MVMVIVTVEEVEVGLEVEEDSLPNFNNKTEFHRKIVSIYDSQSM